MLGRLVLLVVGAVLVTSQSMEADGKPAKWDQLIRSQLAPELKPLDTALRIQPQLDVADQVKDMIDHPSESLPNFLSMAFGNNLPMYALTKGIMDNAAGGFRMPPGVSVPMAPGVGHMVMQSDNGMWGIPNAEKNHISGVQRDAVNAAVGSFRVLTDSGSHDLGEEQEGPATDAWGTRQTSDHAKFPTYGNYLKALMDNYSVGAPGYGLGTVPNYAAKVVSAVNPLFPHAPGPLGSGVDVLGLSRLPSGNMMKQIDSTFNPAMPGQLYPSVFVASDQGTHYGTDYNVPRAVLSQFGNDIANVYPKALSYGASISTSPLSGLQPIFM